MPSTAVASTLVAFSPLALDATDDADIDTDTTNSADASCADTTNSADADDEGNETDAGLMIDEGDVTIDVEEKTVLNLNSIVEKLKMRTKSGEEKMGEGGGEAGLRVDGKAVNKSGAKNKPVRRGQPKKVIVKGDSVDEEEDIKSSFTSTSSKRKSPSKAPRHHLIEAWAEDMSGLWSFHHRVNLDLERQFHSRLAKSKPHCAICQFLEGKEMSERLASSGDGAVEVETTTTTILTGETASPTKASPGRRKAAASTSSPGTSSSSSSLSPTIGSKSVPVIFSLLDSNPENNSSSSRSRNKIPRKRRRKPAVLNPSPNSPLLQCRNCSLVVHAFCYGIPDGDREGGMDSFPASSPSKKKIATTSQTSTSGNVGAAAESWMTWECDACRLHPGGLECALCCLRGGPLKRAAEGAWVHVFCSLALMTQEGEEEDRQQQIETSSSFPRFIFNNNILFDVSRVLSSSASHSRVRDRTCNLCVGLRSGVDDVSHAKTGAFVTCSHVTCDKAFHPACALFCPKVKVEVRVGRRGVDVGEGSADSDVGALRLSAGFEFCCQGIHQDQASTSAVYKYICWSGYLHF